MECSTSYGSLRNRAFCSSFVFRCAPGRLAAVKKERRACKLLKRILVKAMSGKTAGSTAFTNLRL